MQSEAGKAAAKQASESIASLARVSVAKPLTPVTWNHRVLVTEQYGVFVILIYPPYSKYEKKVKDLEMSAQIVLSAMLF